MIAIRFAVVCGAILAATALCVRGASSGTSDSGALHAEARILDSSQPTSWIGVVERSSGELDKAANELAAIAKDEKQPREARRTAINLLGQIRTRGSLQFLAENVALRLPLDVRMGQDNIKEMPCAYALGSAGWGGGRSHPGLTR
jgi:hypothetical protein